MLDYNETVEWMFQQLPMYQKIGASAYKKDLTNTVKLVEALGNPHKKFKSIHVAGTNGKGSTSHMLASIFQEAGYKVGLYTSPHLKDYRERIRLNGKMISQDFVVQFIDSQKGFLESEKLSFFEMSVGMAFSFFASKKVDIAIIEVGMGGRLDSTNIIYPELSVITNIGMDHTQFLGNSLEEIAGEKAGIIKPNVPVVIGEFQEETAPVFKRIAEKNNSRIVFAADQLVDDYESDLKGNYQQKNKATVVTAIKNLPEGWNVTEEAIKKGILKVKENTGLRGRWDILNEKPKVIADTAHNAEGLVWIINQLQKEEFEKLHIVLGVVNDKDLNKILPLFPKDAFYYFCKANVPRGMEAEILSRAAADFDLFGKVSSSVSKAYESALKAAAANDLVYVGGSTFTVAEII